MLDFAGTESSGRSARVIADVSVRIWHDLSGDGSGHDDAELGMA